MEYHLRLGVPVEFTPWRAGIGARGVAEYLPSAAVHGPTRFRKVGCMARSARGESESKTRRTRIDPKLVQQGWKVVPFDPSLPRIAYTTETVWIYDARSNVPGITKKDRPLTDEHFAEFQRCYGNDPNGRSKRKQKDSPPDKGYLGGNRWRKFSIREVESRDFKLDSFKWLKDESVEDAGELPPPEELTTDAIAELEGAVEELNAVLALLENGNGGETEGDIAGGRNGE